MKSEEAEVLIQDLKETGKSWEKAQEQAWWED